jgi:hypothetical protein
MPLGKVSVNGAVRPAGVELLLLNVIVSTDVPPAVIVAGLNALASVGGAGAGGLTVRVATAGTALSPLLV